MSSFNTVTILGNITKDLEIRQVAGKSLCDFSVAVNEKYTNDRGEKVERADFFDVTVWGRQAEALAKYKKKGDAVLIDGALRQERWKDKESGKDRSRVTITATQIVFVGAGKKDEESAPADREPGQDG